MLGKFKGGSIMLAMQAGLPLVPISVIGSRHVMKKGELTTKPGYVRLIVHEPIETVATGHPSTHDVRELADRVRGVIRPVVEAEATNPAHKTFPARAEQQLHRVSPCSTPPEFPQFAPFTHRKLQMLSIGRYFRGTALAALCVVGTAQLAAAQDWKVAGYPILGWLPLGIEMNVDVPPFEGGGGGSFPGGGGDIIDSRFDGAFFGGVSAEKGPVRIDADVLWAAVGGDRLDIPILTVDVDVIYAHGMVGFKVAPDFFVTGGVRRFALDYDIRIGDQAPFSRKPGLWDPLIGVGWHRIGEKIEWHGTVEGGGFGVGADVDFGAGMRVDWKPVAHFGITGGYNFLYFKATNTVAGREFTFKQTLHGPALGIGLYF